MTKQVFKKNTIKSTSFKTGYFVSNTLKSISCMNEPFWFDWEN